jgi:hypothetical protein
VSCTQKPGVESTPITEIKHAYDVFSKKVDPDENTCTEEDNSDCFCTNFDFVWLTNINEAKQQIKDINSKDIDDFKFQELSLPVEQFDAVKNSLTNPIDFILDFFQTYIDIAEDKWKCDAHCDEEQKKTLKDLIDRLRSTKKNIHNFYTKNNKIIDSLLTGAKDILNNKEETEELLNNIPDEDVSEIKKTVAKDLPMLNMMLDIGKYVMYDKKNILDPFTTRELITKLNQIDAFFNPVMGGGKKTKKQIYKKKMYKKLYKTKFLKRGKRGGGKFAVTLGGLFALVGLILLAAATGPVGWALGGIMLIGAAITLVVNRKLIR